MNFIEHLLELEDAAQWAGEIPHLSREAVVSHLPFQLLTKHIGELRHIHAGTRAEVKWEKRTPEYGHLTVTLHETLTDATLWSYTITYTVLLTPHQEYPTK